MSAGAWVLGSLSPVRQESCREAAASAGARDSEGLEASPVGYPVGASPVAEPCPARQVCRGASAAAFKARQLDSGSLCLRGPQELEQERRRAQAVLASEVLAVCPLGL